MITPTVKTDTDILEYYGDVKFVDRYDHNTTKCSWASGQWSRNGYGKNREEAADITLQGLRYIVYKYVRDVESGQ